MHMYTNLSLALTSNHEFQTLHKCSINAQQCNTLNYGDESIVCFSPCFSPAGAGGRSNNAILADVKCRAFTLPPVSPQVMMASFTLLGFALENKLLHQDHVMGYQTSFLKTC